MSAQTPLLDRVASPRDLRQFPEEDLRRIADELRAATVDAVSCTGGHLGAGLGAVELTVALHYVFDTPNDRIVWDVGHQAYPHKILTGRRDRIRTLRQAEGLSGFTKRAESEYDPFGAAHSSTSVSAAFGMAVAHDLKGEGRRAIAVIGDGALSAGMAYEALNNAGAAGHRPLVILNDNNMSIAPSLGAITNYLLDLVPRTDDHRMGEAKRLLAERFPEVLERARQYTCKPCRSPLGADTVFEKLGFEYLGPIDGHAMDQLVPMLTLIRDAEASGPVLLHIITEKGHGYGPAETSADKYHGISKFEVPTGTLQKGKAKAPSYTAVYAQSLIKEAEKDPRIVAITAAMPSGTGVDKFAQRFPDRAFDVGIAEQHGITFAAGLATEGMKPFATIYSTFLQRAYDQIVHDVAIQGLPVRFAMDRAGLVGADGATHAGAYDIAYLGCLPGFVLMAAADEAELVHMVATAAAHDGGPIAFRYPRGEGVGAPLPDAGQPLEIGRGRIVREGTAVALLSFGARLQECLGAADDLADRGFSTTVADARFAKPIDVDLVHRLAREHEALILVEEGSTGGFATQVFHCLAQDGILDQGLKVRSLVLPDRFIDQGAPEQMYEWAGLKAPDIVSAALGVLQATGKPRLAAARAIR